MANTFKSVGTNAIGTVKTTTYTAPSVTTTTVIGLSVANILTTVTSVDIILGKGASEFYIIKNAPIMPGGTLVVVGGDQKLVLETGNTIKVVSTVAASVDVIVSILELS
jgi:hypothetical protein